MTRRFFDVANLCPPAEDDQHHTHQATSSFLTAAPNDEVLMRDEENKKRVTHVRQSTACDRGFLRHFFYPTPRIVGPQYDVGECAFFCDSFLCSI